MTKYLLLNIAYLVFYVLAAIFFLDSFKSKGLPSNGAGILAMFAVIAAGIMFLHLICIGFMFFTKNMTLAIVTTIVTSLMTVAIVVFYGMIVIDKRKTAADQKKWQERMEEENRLENSPEGKRHNEFLEAIYANDSVKIRQMVEQGQKATDYDLSIAVEKVFYSNSEVSIEIFKTLLDHGANASTLSSTFSINQFCNNFEIVKLLLDAGANPLPEKDRFPVTCLPQLKLLLQYKAGINTLSQTYYNFCTYDTNGDRTSASHEGRWTPIMMYLRGYPASFEETKFLLTKNPDLKYKDENGYTLQHVLRDVIYDQTAMGESVEDLLEFEKKIKAL